MKKYILSIEQETKEYFEQTITLIKTRIKEEIFKTPLISNFLNINSIIDEEIKSFMENVIALIYYYVDGIYYNGKMVSRNKLKLEKPKINFGEKYNFTQNDENFIKKYKSIKLESFKIKLTKSINSYLEYLIKNKTYEILNLDDNNCEIVNGNIEKIIDIVDDSLILIYEEFVEYNVSEILNLFKRAQVEEYKNLGIEAVSYFSDNDTLSCPVCSTKSGKIIKINDLIDDFGIKDGLNHAFCRYSIDPVINYKDQKFNNVVFNEEINKKINFELYGLKFINVPIEIESRINKLITKIKIHFNQFINETTIEFIDNITDLDLWVESVKQYYIDKGKNEYEAMNETLKDQNNLKFKVSTFSTENKIYISLISLDSQLIENIILREIIKNKLNVDEWIINRFEEKKKTKEIGFDAAIYKDQFVSYLAEESAENYLIESVVCYIISPSKLEVLDKKMFEYIKSNILNYQKFQEESVDNVK